MGEEREKIDRGRAGGEISRGRETGTMYSTLFFSPTHTASANDTKLSREKRGERERGGGFENDRHGSYLLRVYQNRLLLLDPDIGLDFKRKKSQVSSYVMTC